jgi:hypothetical protein
MSIREKLEVITDRVYEKGKRDEWSDFWDSMSDAQFGEDTFSGASWNDTTFRPKFDIVLKKGSKATNSFKSTNITNLKRILSECGVALDFSGAMDVTYVFYLSPKLTELPELNFTGVKQATRLTNAMSYCSSLTSIDKIILSNDYTATNGNVIMFQNCPLLTDVVFEGTIAFSFDVSGAPLSPDSMKSIISCLKDYSGTSNAMKYTLTFNSDCWSRLNASELPDGFNAWQVYVNSLGWIDGVA